MESDYKTKVMKPAKAKAVSHAEGHIYEEDGLFKFSWNNTVCGYKTEKEAKADLKKFEERRNGQSSSEDNS
tara:strand:- start:187 stop:399 length:213 start_codon:yes stop_codon:yes gene_type:complete